MQMAHAMFDAARAALMAFQNSDEVLTIKTHSGLISSFSLQLVKPGMIDIELGKALNKVEDLRLIADYKGDSSRTGANILRSSSIEILCRSNMTGELCSLGHSLLPPN